MAQPSSPSMSLPDGFGDNHQSNNSGPVQSSDTDVLIDSLNSQASATYPSYSPHPPDQGIYQGYQLPYGYMPQQRPSHEQWGGYPPRYMPPYGHPPTSGARPGQVYSFVPIPGAQQHKRPRRRYEEVERMYKCGYIGCEKTYGTLNHLNAHVTMQSHGTKRTPEEFKEIRKEWKARKKGEENARKAEDERACQAAQAQQADGQTLDGQHAQDQVYQQNGARPSLPSINHQAPESYAQAQYVQAQGGMVYAPQNGQMQSYLAYPNLPYGQQSQVYKQRQYQPLLSRRQDDG